MSTKEDAKGLDRWRYVIVLAKFVVHVLHPGIPKSLSILIPSLVHQLDLDYTTVGFLITLEVGVMCIACPISSYLSQKLGSRPVATVGGFLAGVSLMTGSLSQTSTLLGCSFFFTGVFASPLRQVSSETLHQHFGEQFGLAVTVTQLGSQLGSLLLPYLTMICLNVYGMKGTLLILSAFMLHGVPIGATMRPPRLHRRSKTKDDYYNERNDSEQEHELLQNGRDIGDRVKSTAKITPKSMEPQSKEPYANLVQSTWTFFLRIIYNIFNFVRDERIFTFLLLPCQFLFDVSYGGWIVFLFPYGISEELPEERAVYLVMAGSVGGIVGRCVLIAVFYKYPLLSTHMLASNIGIASVALFAYPISSSLIYLILCSFIGGFGFYNAYSCFYGSVSFKVQKKNFPRAISYSMMLSGIAYLLSGILTGFMYDLFGSYRVIFRILGILLAVVSVAISIFICVEPRPSREEKS